MLDIYVWNPSKTGKENPYSNDFKTLAKTSMKGGAVGHISLAVTLYEDNKNFKAVSTNPNLSDILKPAAPTYERVIINQTEELTEYGRGRKLQGVTAVNSFWPSKPIGKKLFGKSILKAGSKVDSILADSITKDMISESTIPNALIHHGKFFKTDSGFVSHRERLHSALLKQAEQYDLNYLSLINEMTAVDNSLKQMQERYPSLKYNGNLNDPMKVLGLKKIKIHYWYYKKNYEDGDGKVYASSINYEAISDTLESAKQLEETAKNEFLRLLPELKGLNNTFLNSLCEEYLELTRELSYLSKSTAPFAEAHHAIADTQLAIVRMQMMNEMETHSGSAEHQRLKGKMVAVASRLHACSQQVDTISRDIETIEKLKDKLIKIQLEKDDNRAKKLLGSQEIDKLIREISAFEQTEGRNADHIISLPTSDSGKHFFIDEVAMLKQIKENSKGNTKYQLFGENCARNVKGCLLAAIHGNKELNEALKNNLPKNFFRYKFLETPGSVMKWVLELSRCLDTLNSNYDHDQEQSLTPSNGLS